MIYTITPNPALDLSGTVDQLVPNEKNYVRSETRCPGGNGINVARLLTRLKVPVLATGFLGKSVGAEIIDLLDLEGVKHDFIRIEGHTRISLTVSNLKTNQQTRLSFPGPKISTNEKRLLIKKAAAIPRDSMLIIGGSLPPGFKTSDLNSTIQLALKRKIPVAVDVPGHLLRSIRLDGLLLIKPNLTEFQELTGSNVKSISAVGKAAQKLAKKVRFVCVSSVEGGAILASRDSLSFASPPKIKLMSTVGAGDSMVAGIVGELWRRRLLAPMTDDLLLPELLRHALAAAAATLSVPGTQLGSSGAIRKLLDRVIIK